MTRGHLVNTPSKAKAYVNSVTFAYCELYFYHACFAKVALIDVFEVVRLSAT